MKNYLAFYGDVYYPNGGMADFIGDFDTKDEAISAIEKEHQSKRPEDVNWEYSWANVYSLKDRIEVFTK